MAEQVSQQQIHHESGPTWLNPWHWPLVIWAFFVGAVLLILPFGIRAVMLQTVPSIAEPFDIAEFSKWDVPASEDAFTEYRRASEHRSQIAEELQATVRPDPESISAVLEGGWSSSDDALKRWLTAYSEPLATWRRGTERRRGLIQRPDTLSLDTVVLAIQDQQFFSRMALCELEQALSESRYEQGYQWARAILRSGGPFSHRGCLIQGLVGAAGHAMACRGLQHWSAQGAVTEEQLQQALATVQTDYELYEKRSNILKAEYLAVRNSLASSDWLQETSAGTGATLTNNRAVGGMMRMGYWMVGEPELSARLFRQMLANQIHEVDKPIAQRCKQSGKGLAMLFDPDPAVPLMPGQLDPDRIDQGTKKSLVLQSLSPSVQQVDAALVKQEARQRTLETMLALQAYRRRHGDFPEALAPLVPGYLKAVPLDPCDRAGGTLLYRRDAARTATVWSVGDDGVDSGGEVDLKLSPPPDVGFTLQ